MSQTIRIYVVTSNNRTYAASVNLLRGEPFPDPDLKEADGTAIVMNVDSEQDVENYFLGQGVWHTIEAVDDIDGEMDVKIELRMWTKDDEGLRVKSLLLQDAALASVAVKAWSFKDELGRPVPVSVAGFQSLPKSVRRAIGQELTVLFYYGIPTHESFTRPLTSN